MVNRSVDGMTADLCRQHGMSSATFFGWKAKFGGMDGSDAKRLSCLRKRTPR
jgi:putative transposase